MAAASVESAAVRGEDAEESCCIRGGGTASSFADSIHQKQLQSRPEEVDKDTWSAVGSTVYALRNRCGRCPEIADVTMIDIGRYGSFGISESDRVTGTLSVLQRAAETCCQWREE